MTQKNYKPVKTNKVGGSPFTGVLGWIDNRLPIFRMLKHEYLDFQVPRNLNYFWSFGGILMICLVTLIITGIALGMHYKPDANLAFESVERIMRDVEGGWLIRYIHMNMASFFFIAVYIHIFRSFYGSYKHNETYVYSWMIFLFLRWQQLSWL